MSDTEHTIEETQSIESLLCQIEEFRNGISTLDADLTAHIRSLELMSTNLDEIIAELTEHTVPGTESDKQCPKHDVSSFEERVRTMMTDMNRDAIALRTLREEAMRLRENCIA